MTGRQLMRRLRANPVFVSRLSNARLVPLGAWPVLEAVAKLVAASPEPGVYRPDPQLGSLCEQVAVLLGCRDADAEIAAHLATLTRVGLLVAGEDGAVKWPLAVSRGSKAGGRA